MQGPYRAPLALEAEPLPSTCVADPRDARCLAAAPRACLFDLTRARRALSPLALRALGAAATLLLLVGAASLAAITWSVVDSQARLAAVAESREARAITVERATGSRRGALPPLAAIGPETHDVDTLWMRAEQLAASGFDLRTARALLPAGSIAASATDHARVEHEGNRGLRIADLDPRGTAAQAGLMRGDRVLAVNGLALRYPYDLSNAWDTIVKARAAVLEIERDGHPLVLRVDERW
jgi:hypothetical protein